MPYHYHVHCPADDCGEVVGIDLGGFSSTTATIEACSAQKAAGIVSYEIRKSAALDLPLVNQPEPVAHQSGLVVFA